MIPVMRPRLPDPVSVLPLLQEIHKNQIYSNRGPVVQRLEEMYANFFSVNPAQVVLMANATVAIQGCLETYEETDWAIPNFTFAATGHAAVNSGKKVFLYDVYADSYDLNLSLVQDFVHRGRGIVPVTPFGSALDFTKYEKFNNVVIDAASSLGAPIPDFTLMRDNWCVVYSLHATKVLGCGEGGLVVSSIERAARLRSWCNFGFLGSRESRFKSTNAKMSEMMAAFAMKALENEPVERSEWREALDMIAQLMNGSPLDTYINSMPGYRPYWIIRTSDLQHTEKMEHILKVAQIQTRRWWETPLNEMSAFANLPYIGGQIGKKLSQTLIGLPIFRGITKEELRFIYESISDLE
jgi:dTDP-4-amino-4,6-dideoxygalactose transaminase